MPDLRDLDVSKNSLQGTFEFLVKNKSLEYIDASDNCIKDPLRLEPLKAIKNVSFCLKGNPIANSTNSNTWSKGFGAKIIKEPKKK